MNYRSVFDIIDPITIGTSNTFGADTAKIGYIIRQLFSQEPERIDISLYGGFKTTNHHFGADVAIIGGILGFKINDSLIINALTIAKERGIKINCIEEIAKPVHSHTAKICLYKGKDKIEMLACSLRGGRVKIIEVNGFELKLREANPALLIMNNNHFSTISSVIAILSSCKININKVRISRKETGKLSILIIETEKPLVPELIGKIKKLSGIHQALILD
ncbi:L-serine ammonia-lyase, iron-sulfur-dependent subunit beta [Bacillus toyonensis]|uniref:L-serine ammonia-lyase, iron-sulfur-dependent subunit beta n=1 Tax=Bacillus toyonensis TaxID=155322 RepID=UPI0018CF5579|nr:L-serine ammonia-lyase, iron-sulfur-dependent subunit beta [Bacillus toyonensis]MBG9608872.1 serine dehydratase [Bacillus toyonensis]MBG9845724.1 serine dehydratase [Bacillus toyonensis]MBG9851659.1 serine dehydratase [Bacillus toyonensis]MBG9871535.1 serine dehydratase [Bacillus toyonensis]MBG9889881.1 serine dehydratase [Bacillus toyonensis]